MTTENNKYEDIIENLPGLLHHGDNMLVMMSTGPLMVNYLGDHVLCISGVKEEERIELFHAIEDTTEFQVTNFLGNLNIYVPEYCTGLGAVADIMDEGQCVLRDMRELAESKKTKHAES